MQYVLQFHTLLLLIGYHACKATDNQYWSSYQFDSGHGNREELVITKVDAEDNFQTQENVLKWKSLSLRHKGYALGLTQDGVTVMQAVLDDKGNGSFKTNATHIPLNATILDAVIFQHETQAVISAIATKNMETNHSIHLSWYSISNSNKLIPIWKWSDLRKHITHFNIFKIEEIYYILICTTSLTNASSADLYQFNLNTKEYWLTQTIKLDSPSYSTAISSYGPHTYISIAQKTDIKILRFENTHFIPHYNLTARNIHCVTSFKIGFKTFLAIDGLDAGIYQFTKRDFQKIYIPEPNLQGIDYWLSIPLRTYRDEQILIAERSLDHTTHNSYDIEVLLYNDGKFVVHDEMACDYYGDISNGMNCLVEEDSTNGVKGSAFFALGDVVGVLVPRKNAPSGLFVIHTELKTLESPVQKQIKAFDALRLRLEKKMQSQKSGSFVAKKNNSEAESIAEDNVVDAAAAAATLKQGMPMFWRNPEATTIDDLVNRINNIQIGIDDMLRNMPAPGNYKNLIVNGLVQVKGISNIELVEAKTFNGGVTADVFEDIVRMDNLKPILSPKTFINLNVDSLTFKKVNGMPSNNIAFKNTTVVINGDLIFHKDVVIVDSLTTQTVNDLNLEKELVQIGKNYTDPIQFEELNVKGGLEVKSVNQFPIHQHYLEQVDEQHDTDSVETKMFENVFIPGNITVENVNGLDFGQFLSSLRLRNLHSYIPGKIHVEGDITVNGAMTIYNLNGLKYPEEYIFANSASFSKITGPKIFNEEVLVNELITATINGVNPDNVVTLTTDQNLTGKFIFADLKMTENLIVENITGGGLDEFPSNPTLLDTHNIISNMNFNILEVNGVVTIENQFNGTNLFDTLNDVIYKDDQSAKITSLKEFPSGLTVHENMIVTSNAINNIPLDQFVDKETKQTLQTNILNGSVAIENLALLGNFGEVNITKLDQDSVKLTGEQYISSKLIFEDEISVEDLEINDSLNDLHFTEYLYTDDEFVIEEGKFDDVKVENLNVVGDLVAEDFHFNLNDFDERRLSLTKEQNVTGDFHIGQSRIQNLKTQMINGYLYDDVFGLEKFNDKIMKMLYDGKLKIKELFLKQSVNVTSINNTPLQEIVRNLVWSNQNKRMEELYLKGNVYLQDLQLYTFNNINFTDLHANIIYKNQTDNLEIFAPKFYQEGYTVQNYITAPMINYIKVENILRKVGEQEVTSPLIIDGEILLHDDIEIREFLNEVPIQYLTDTFEVIDEDSYRIKGDVVFPRMTMIKDLTVEDQVNDHNITEFFENMIHITSDIDLDESITFLSPVNIDANLGVKNNINGIDFSKLKDEIVLVTSDSSVESLVTFVNPVIITEEFNVEKHLYGETVMGIDLNAWKQNAVFINEGRIAGLLRFEDAFIGGNVNCEYLNEINMSSLIPLREEQVIIGKLLIDELQSFNDVPVGGLINGYKLEPEVLNTAMIDQIQEITSKVVFENNVVARTNLKIAAPINGFNFDNLVTVNGVQNLTAQYEFLEKCTIDGNLYITEMVSGVNLTQWLETGIRKSDITAVDIIQPWEVKQNLTFDSGVIGSGALNKLDVQKMADQVMSMKQFKTTVEQNLIQVYQKICIDVNSMIDASKKQVYLFKYLDFHQFIEVPNVEIVHQFEYKEFNYIVVKAAKSCTSLLFIWSSDWFEYVREIETGDISEIINVYDGDNLYVVTAENSCIECDVRGTNVWKFETDNLLIIQNIENLFLLQDSKLSGTFYGMNTESVKEFRLTSQTETSIQVVRKWMVDIDNAAFIPRGLGTGPALRNGESLIKLNQEDLIVDAPYADDYNTIVIGNTTILENYFMPGRFDGEMLIMKVGYPRRKTLVAVSSHEETTVKGKLDDIKIYENVMEGTMFHKLPSNKPSSLLTLQFEQNGETLMVFLEDNSQLHVYEYKGLEGFKYRTTASVDGWKLVALELPLEMLGGKQRSFVGLLGRNGLELMQAVMDGDQIHEKKLNCVL